MGKELLRTMDRLGMILDVDANHVAIGSDLDGAFAGISYCNRVAVIPRSDAVTLQSGLQ